MRKVIQIGYDGQPAGNPDSLRWAVGQLESVLDRAGARVVHDEAGDDVYADLRIVVAAVDSPAGERALQSVGAAAPTGAESYVLARPDGPAGAIVVVAGSVGGAVYALLDLADIATHAADPLASLRRVESAIQSPATPLRGILRPFVSYVEDMPWFGDEAFWRDYLTELATHRINRLQLAFGIQFNFGHNPVSDNYFCFPYPFLLDVPGYDVRVENVSDRERDNNLAMLRHISDEAKLRGIGFQLGLWNHAYDQTPGDHTYDRGQENRPYFPITGLTHQTAADYSGAALEQLLRACPSIDGLTLRVHYEGGVPDDERSDFWRRTLSGVGRIGRPIEIDMHAKGVDQAMIDVARSTGQRVVLSVKYWAEHLGLPYHQASIREKERVPVGTATGLRAITGFERSFTRYGYGDFLREDRDFDVIYRVWPGGQRVLLWGDPVLAAGYGRQGTFGGSRGIEWFDPLSFKGRKGTSTPGGRDPYADPDLQFGGQEWRKYLYTYRLWGRLTYDPEAAPDVWRRYLDAEFGAAGASVERALAPASRIIPLVTVSHAVGASISGYWPEMYIDMPIVDGPHFAHYEGDSHSPPSFAGVSSFDPQLFASVADHATTLVAGTADGRYTPTDVAGWLESLADEAEHQLALATSQVADRDAPTFRRMSVDVTALANLGRFFAGKFRAALAHALFEQTGDPTHLHVALDAYRGARAAYGAVVEVTNGVYRADLTFGYRLSEHGHWSDRLPAIDQDVAALERLVEECGKRRPERSVRIAPPVRAARTTVTHRPQDSFVPGDDLPVRVSTSSGFTGAVTLAFRHLNHREAYERVEMERDGDGFQAVVPGSYTRSKFPLLYYFTVFEPGGDAWLSPGLDPTFDNQPYYVVRAT